MAAPVSGDTPLVWSSRLTFLMASVGFAVGLGNIWRFPFVVGENGGSAFILVYLGFAVLIGVPLVMAEWTIGRRAKDAASASGSVRGVASDSGASTKWGAVGGIAVLAVFMLMLIYTTIAGWTMDYFVRAASGAFEGITGEASTAAYESLMASPMRLVFWHTVVVILTVYINSRGLHGGIEKAVNILMPALFVSLVLMVGYAFFVGDMGAAAKFLLTPDFSKVTGETLLMALGQAFFSIGIAMAVMITYGSYLDKKTSIPQNAFIVVGADTLVALMAGFAIFPLVFAHGMAPDAGEGLVFQALPVAFGDLPAGSLFASIFFFLLIAAAVTSCIGNFAPVVAWTEETGYRFGTFVQRVERFPSARFHFRFRGQDDLLEYRLHHGEHTPAGRRVPDRDLHRLVRDARRDPRRNGPAGRAGVQDLADPDSLRHSGRACRRISVRRIGLSDAALAPAGTHRRGRRAVTRACADGAAPGRESVRATRAPGHRPGRHGRPRVRLRVSSGAPAGVLRGACRRRALEDDQQCRDLGAGVR